MRKFQISDFRFQISLIFLLVTIHCLLFTNYAYSQGMVIMAGKVSGDLSLDPSDSQWNRSSSVDIPLAVQVMAKPRIYKSAFNHMKVKALHNTKEIAFLVEWPDDTEDASVDVNKFSDAVALEFPSSSAGSKPHFAMGDKENTVNIWFWKALWQTPEENNKTYATVDDFAGGVLAGNPVSKARASLAENIIAQGFGSATDMEKTETQNIAASGKRQSNNWMVVFKRQLVSQEKFDVNFLEGGVTPVAFAVWNGSESNRGGKKVVSTWYYVGLETEEKKTIYAYPVIAFIGAAGIETLIILGLRKRRKT